MAIRYACPHCGRSGTTSDDLAGRIVKCPDCQKPVELPAAQWATRGDETDTQRLPDPTLDILDAAQSVDTGDWRPAIEEILDVLDRNAHRRDELLQKIGKDVENINGNLGYIFAMLLFWLICSVIAGLIALSQH